jgi:hypothetical protein
LLFARQSHGNITGRDTVTRLVVAAVLVVAVVGAADAVRRSVSEQVVERPPERPTPLLLLRGDAEGFSAVGPFTRTSVVREGREVLTAAQVDAAFPAPFPGEPFDIAHVAVAPDGTLVLAVYKFPYHEPARAAIELWRGNELVGAFPVPDGSFAAGLGFSADGELVGMYSPERQATLYDRAGRRAG